MTAAGQLRLVPGPPPNVERVVLLETFRGFDAEVAMRITCVVDLGERDVAAPLVRIEGAVVVDTGEPVPADELAQMLAFEDFRQALKACAYDAAVRRRRGR